MLNTFDNTNDMLLASVQELTAELATAQSKIAALENGGGSGGGKVYLTLLPNNAYTIIQRVPKIGDIQLDRMDEEAGTIYYEIPVVSINTTLTTESARLLNYDGSTFNADATLVASIGRRSIYLYNNNYYLEGVD